jgi:hypothetical protein
LFLRFLFALPGGLFFRLVLRPVGVALGGLDRALGRVHLLLHRVPRPGLFDHRTRHRIGRAIFRSVIVSRAADDQRRAGLVDQHAVHLIDDRKIQRSLHLELDALLHVVAQVIEPELAIGAVGNVAAILPPAGLAAGLHVGLEPADAHA